MNLVVDYLMMILFIKFHLIGVIWFTLQPPSDLKLTNFLFNTVIEIIKK